jgi:cellobiose-specific phosphotransferase system component IIC
MDASTITLIAITVTLVAACVAMFAGYLRAMRRAGSESRRRLIARSAIITWATLAILTPAIMLAGLGVLPNWVPGVGLIIACVVGVLSARHARRSTMRSHGFV